jgi:hypothetical protein
MSSHRLSVSGERPYTLTAGGGPMSACQFPAKTEDGIHVQLGGVTAEIPLFPVPQYATTDNPEQRPSVRIERRVYREGPGKGETVMHVLVLEGTLNVWATSPLHGMPHSNIDVRKPGPDGRNPINYGREEVSREIVDELAIPEVTYEPGEGELTETNLVNAVVERGIAKADEHAPRVLAVGDRATELRARRILHSTDPESGEKIVAGGLAKLEDLPVEIDESLGEGGWELR